MDESDKILVDSAFIELVRKAYITEDLSLPEDVIIRIARYLFIFQNEKANESILRDSSKKDRQNRLVSVLLNSAKKLSEKLDECLRDPVLVPRLLEAYKQAGYVDKLHVRTASLPYYVDIYDKKISAGDNPEEELLNLVGKLMLLEKAVGSITPESSPFPSNKKAQIPLPELIRRLDEVLAPYVSETCSKSERARHIADYISLIDLEVINAEYMRNTLTEDPDAVGLAASADRYDLIEQAGISELAIDAAESIKEPSSLEKMLVHQLALAHGQVFTLTTQANVESDGVEKARLLNSAARFMKTYQDGLLCLNRIRSGGVQRVIVQHVTVADGGQAVVAGEVSREGGAKNGGG